MSTPTTPTPAPTDNANATANKPDAPSDSIRFKDGVIAKGKLIGVEDVKDETGDETCNTSMVKLKAVVIAKKEHKLPILIKISYEGVHILDAKTNEVLYHHPVDRISYIARDPNDARAFGYIFRNAKYELQYIAIKTERQSSEVVLTLKDLFEDVYEQKKAKRDQAKKEAAAAAANPNALNANSELISQQEQTQPVISANIFDLDENIPPPPTPQNTPSQSIQDPRQQPIPNINPPPPQPSIINSPPGYAAQLSTSPTLMPIEASPKTDVLSLFDTLQSSSNTNSNIQKSASNADMLNSLNFSPTAEQSSADRLNTLKQQIGNLSGNSSLGTSPNPFGLRAPPGPPQAQSQVQSLPGSYGGSPNPNPFGAGQYGSLSPQPQTNMYGQTGFPQYATSPMQQQQQQPPQQQLNQFPQFNAYQQPPGPYQPQPQLQPQYGNQQLW